MAEKTKNLLAGFQVVRTPQPALKIAGAAAGTRAASANVPPSPVAGKGKQVAVAEPSKKKKKIETAPPPPDTQTVVEVSPTSGTAAEVATSRWAPDLQYRGCTPVVSDSIGVSPMVA